MYMTWIMIMIKHDMPNNAQSTTAAEFVFRDVIKNYSDQHAPGIGEFLFINVTKRLAQEGGAEGRDHQ